MYTHLSGFYGRYLQMTTVPQKKSYVYIYALPTFLNPWDQRCDMLIFERRCSFQGNIQHVMKNIPEILFAVKNTTSNIICWISKYKILFSLLSTLVIDINVNSLLHVPYHLENNNKQTSTMNHTKSNIALVVRVYATNIMYPV